MSGRNFKKLQDAHLARAERIASRLDKLYQTATNDLIDLSVSVPFDDDGQFYFSDYPELSDDVKAIVSELALGIEQVVLRGTTAEWAKGSDDANGIIEDILEKAGIGSVKDLSDHAIGKYFNNHESALKAFQKRSIGGLSLSQKVWNLADHHKIETELARSIATGTSAEELSRSVRQCLNEPDKLFRRVRDKYGVLRLSRNARAYEPGPGTYRSSYKNAMRLAVTEINMAYRNAEIESYQDQDYIVGIEIHRSSRPYHCPVCEALAGKYPKDFNWNGWHPRCRCFITPILITDDEMDARRDAIINGEEYDSSKSVNAVNDVPENYKAWVSDNKDRIAGAEQRGTLPHFLAENEGYYKTALRFDKQAEIEKGIASIEADDKVLAKQVRSTLKWARTYSIDTSKIERMLMDGSFTEDKFEALRVGIADAIDDRSSRYAEINNRLYHLGLRLHREEFAGIAGRQKLLDEIAKYRSGFIPSEQKPFSASLEKAASKFLASAERQVDYMAAKKPTVFTPVQRSAPVVGLSRPYGISDKEWCDKLNDLIEATFANPKAQFGAFGTYYKAGKYADAISLVETNLTAEQRRYLQLGQKVEVLRRIPESLYQKVPDAWRQSLNAAIDRINQGSGKLESVQSDIEYAYNIYRLVTNKTVQRIGLANVSPMMPNELFCKRMQSAGIFIGKEDILGNPIYETLKQFFDKFNRYVPLELGGTGKTAHYSPQYKMVVYNFDYVDANGALCHIDRQKASNYKYRLIFHEFGHAYDDQAGIRTSAEFQALFDKYYDIVNKEVNGTRPNFTRLRASYFDAYSRRLKLYGGTRKYETYKELQGEFTDTLQALDKNADLQGYEIGHDTSYFLNDKSLRQAEFIAHMVESYWLGNPEFALMYPELLDDMLKFMAKFYGAN